MDPILIACMALSMLLCVLPALTARILHDVVAELRHDTPKDWEVKARLIYYTRPTRKPVHMGMYNGITGIAHRNGRGIDLASPAGKVFTTIPYDRLAGSYEDDGGMTVYVTR